MTTRVTKSANAPKGAEHNSEGPEPLNLKRIVELWLEGEWILLAAYDEALVAAASDRGMIAAHIACAHQFCDDDRAAEVWARRSKDWGCSDDYLVRVLTSGAHITMARMAGIAGDANRARMHMRETSDPFHGEQATASAEARLSKELAAMGLLNMSAAILDEDLQAVIDQPFGQMNRHRLNAMKSELRLLRHQLVLQQSRSRRSKGSDPTNSLSDAERAEQHSVSQLGQDIWALKRTGYKRNGFFVEFGATDGVLLSNTYMLESQFDWEGLLAEPNPEYFSELCKNRSSKASDACISGRTGDTVDFVLADEFGTIKDYIGDDEHADRRNSYAELPEAVVTLSTVSLDDFLKQNDAPKHIDYISVDTEGSEFDILAPFPFEDWDVSVWTVEHNFTENRQKIFELMSGHGYLRKAVDFDDWYYKADSEG